MFTFHEIFDIEMEDIPRVLENFETIRFVDYLNADRLEEILEKEYQDYCERNGLCIECGEEKKIIRTQIGEVDGRILWEDIFMCPNNH